MPAEHVTIKFAHSGTDQPFRDIGRMACRSVLDHLLLFSLRFVPAVFDQRFRSSRALRRLIAELFLTLNGTFVSGHPPPPGGGSPGRDRSHNGNADSIAMKITGHKSGGRRPSRGS